MFALLTGRLTQSVIFFASIIILGAGTAGADTVDVSIPGFLFSPDTAVITAGSTVRWTNNHTTSHTSTSNTAVWSSGPLSPGQHFSFTFNSAGSFPYHCEIHPSMMGIVVVNPAPSCCVLAGDANHSGTLNALDVTYLINFLYKSGAPVCLFQGGRRQLHRNRECS